MHLSPCLHSGILLRSYWCRNSHAAPFMHRSLSQWRQTTVRSRGSYLAEVMVGSASSPVAKTEPDFRYGRGSSVSGMPFVRA